MRQFWNLVPLLGLSACMGGGGPPPARTPAASVEYQLPITSAKVAIDLVLQSCDANMPIATAKAVITPVANPNYAPQQRFRLYGANLSSFSKNRQLALELYPNGAIKSINGGVADRTGAIITNILKIGAGLIGFGAPPPPPVTLTGACNDKTQDALKQVGLLETRIGALRATLVTATAPDAEHARLAIDALAAEVARLRTGPLALSLEREILFRKGHPAGTDRVPAQALKDMQGGMIRWKPSELAKWLVVPAASDVPASQFSFGYCVRPATAHFKADAVSCSAMLAGGYQSAEDAVAATGSFVETPRCYSTDASASCPRTLVFREPVDAVLVLVAASDDLKGAKKDSQVALQQVSISQWGSVSELPLDVGFGGNFTMAAGFSEFGKQTSFTWKSDARGEAITGAVSGIVDAAGTFRNAFTTDLEDDKAEIERLETSKKLNELEFCRQVIEAGGFKCPTPTP